MSTRRKTLEAQERSTAESLSHETSLSGFSGERHNALTACATRANNENENVGHNCMGTLN